MARNRERVIVVPANYRFAERFLENNSLIPWNRFQLFHTKVVFDARRATQPPTSTPQQISQNYPIPYISFTVHVNGVTVYAVQLLPNCWDIARTLLPMRLCGCSPELTFPAFLFLLPAPDFSVKLHFPNVDVKPKTLLRNDVGARIILGMENL